MKPVLLLVGIAALAANAHATEYAWRENSADPDNLFTNVVHFSPALANGIGDIEASDTVSVNKSNGDLTVKIPAGDALSATIAPKFSCTSGYTLMIDVRGASWTQPDASVAYPGDARLVLDGVFKCSGTGKTAGAFKFDNVLFTVARQVGDPKETSATLSSGLLNLYDPNGTPLTDNIWATGDSQASTFRFTVTDGASMRMAPALFYAYAATNEWNFLSGSNFIKKVNIRVVDDASTDDDYPRTRFLVSGENTCLDVESFESGNYHGHRYEVRNGATLVFSGTGGYSQPETCFGLVFDNARLEVPNSSNFDWQRAKIWATNSTFTTRKMTIQSGFAMLKNTDWTATGNLGTAWNGYGDTRLELDGGSITCPRLVIGYQTGVHTFRVAGGARVLADKAGTDDAFSIGETGKHGGKYDAADSRVYLEDGMICAPTVAVGGSGTALLEVSGGSLVSAGALKFICNAADGKTATLTQTGGEVAISNGVTLVASASAANSAALISLDGGTMSVKGSISGGDGCSAKNAAKTSTATLRGNGGKLRALAASDAFVQQLNAAECGAKGLTIESDYDIAMPQSFSDISGESGELILTGSGRKRLSGAATTVARIVVAGGTVELASGSTFASEVVVTNGASVVFGDTPAALGITNLVFGSAAFAHVLTLDAAAPFEVAVPLSLVNVALDVGGEFADEGTYTLMAATAGVSAGSIAAWENAEFSVAVADGSHSYRLTTAQDGGTTLFQIVASGAMQTITVGEGETREYSDAISFGSHEAVVADVASNATLTISGDVACGSLMKRGLGRVVISGASKSIAAGVYCEGGIVSVSDASVLAGCGGVYVTDGTFEFAGSGSAEPQVLPCPLFGRASDANGIVDLKIESPLVVTNAAVTSGCIVKRGVAALTFTPAPGETMTLSCNWGFPAQNDWTSNPNVSGDVGSDYWQRPTDSGYIGFNVAEGTVELKGDAAAHVDIVHGVSIGLNMAGVRVAPALVVDGLSANLASAAKGGQINIGAGIKQTTGSKGAFARIDVQNGAIVSTRACRTQNLTSFASAVTARVDRATWTISQYLLPYGAASPVEKFFLLVQNGGKVYVGNYFQDFGGNAHVVELDGEGTVLAKNADLEGLTWGWLGCDISVKNGAALYAAKTQIRDYNGQKDMRLTFDGGTWVSTPSTSQPYRFWKSTNVVVSVSGAGQTFPVAAEQTVYVNAPITGDGGFVKTGDGALDFASAMSYDGTKKDDQSTWVGTALEDPVTLAFGGELDVRGGTVTVSNGCCRTGGAYRTAEGTSIDFDGNNLGSGAVFSGAGTFANATVGDCEIAASVADGTAPSFAGVRINGRIRVRFDGLADGVSSATVATFTDGMPDVSRFYVTRLAGSHKASFFVDGNAVKAEIWKSGAIMIVR